LDAGRRRNHLIYDVMHLKKPVNIRCVSTADAVVGHARLQADKLVALPAAAAITGGPRGVRGVF
jgi:hypothetical protein